MKFLKTLNLLLKKEKSVIKILLKYELYYTRIYNLKNFIKCLALNLYKFNAKRIKFISYLLFYLVRSISNNWKYSNNREWIVKYKQKFIGVNWLVKGVIKKKVCNYMIIQNKIIISWVNLSYVLGECCIGWYLNKVDKILGKLTSNYLRNFNYFILGFQNLVEFQSIIKQFYNLTNLLQIKLNYNINSFRTNYTAWFGFLLRSTKKNNNWKPDLFVDYRYVKDQLLQCNLKKINSKFTVLQLLKYYNYEYGKKLLEKYKVFRKNKILHNIYYFFNILLVKKIRYKYRLKKAKLKYLHFSKKL